MDKPISAQAMWFKQSISALFTKYLGKTLMPFLNRDKLTAVREWVRDTFIIWSVLLLFNHVLAWTALSKLAYLSVMLWIEWVALIGMQLPMHFLIILLSSKTHVNNWETLLPTNTTVGFLYITVQNNTILHTVQQLRRQHFEKISNSQKTVIPRPNGGAMAVCREILG